MSTNFDSYKNLWTVLKPSILEKMTALVDCLTAQQTSYEIVGPYISGPDEEFGSDEYKVTVSLQNESGITVLSADFALRDGADDGVKGFSIACLIEGYNALALGGFQPNAYAEDFFTLDQEVLESRVEEFDAYEFSLAIEEALQDETLLEEVAEAS